MRISWFLACLVGIMLGQAMNETAGDEPPESLRFPVLTNAQAWRRLQREEPALPVWARVLAKSLPRTTAEMLKLDYLHRAQSPLDAELRAKLRWVAAETNGCMYSKLYAEADLRRAGLSDSDWKVFTEHPESLPADEQAAVAFARQMTQDASSVTDDDIADLLGRFGPKDVVALVHTMAFANFQDRIFLALGIQKEADGPYPPVDIAFDSNDQRTVKLPKRKPWEKIQNTTAPLGTQRLQWRERSFSNLQESLTQQRSRASRIPLPESSEAGTQDAEAARSRIVWSAVSSGYQPLLTSAWFRCMRTFQQEAKLDDVFRNSVFWVVTRSNECFY